MAQNNSANKTLLWLVAALAVVLIGVVAFAIIQTTSLKADVEEARLANEELMLDNQQLQLSNEFDMLSSEFAHYEDQAQRLANDTILAKYTAAKAKVEQLLDELKNEKVKSAARIKELQGEISTLKGLLKHYVSQIDSLSRENGQLREENSQIREQNSRLNNQIDEVRQNNRQLNERITLAEKLNVTAVGFTALKKNGKVEKNITKAKQLKVTFTVPQNNSTPEGQKTFYLRIVSPEGQLLGSGGTFAFEGAQVGSTARKTIEYAGEEVSGITIYWDVNTTLNPGAYTVELFVDGYRVYSRSFDMKK